ncbi:hypothetical protein R8Z57_11755 [Microbacterium sp. M3]|uniref:Uncharacterized protein n=1 Tax=Microbacterium arthrosphaerae TaxID=792652 RepID=A0ABU4H287_9MICO|nr:MULTISPECIES: hypothetical protein [Microbacterium]MDW4573447.1 hypothetical protein [Microbacterium arthrosphaerae]MDW7607302.1 hypothetical protein [Microbacterium sp. M3]
MLVAELVLCAIGVVAATVVTLNFGSLPWDDHLGEIIGAFGLLIVIFAVFLRIWWAKDLVPRPRFIWFLPAAMALILTPGAVTDSAGRSAAEEVWLLLLAAYGSALLGFLVLVFVFVPLEMLGRGILRLVTGKPDGGWLIFGGAVIALTTTFAVVGVFAVDDLPPGRAAAIPIICALLGIPFGYTVQSETLLWVARGLALLLIALLLASAHFGDRRRARRVQADAADAEADRRRRDERRAAQVARDRDARRRREQRE